MYGLGLCVSFPSLIQQCWWQIETLIGCGELSKNSVFIQEHTDITGKCSVIMCSFIIHF